MCQRLIVSFAPMQGVGAETAIANPRAHPRGSCKTGEPVCLRLNLHGDELSMIMRYHQPDECYLSTSQLKSVRMVKVARKPLEED